MPDPYRIEALNNARTLVVKVGTRVLTRIDGRLDRDRIESLAQQLCEIMDTGRNVVLVSSGAVGAGVGKLGLSARPKALADLQAVAAIGQTELIQVYERAFSRHQRHGAQVLLTAEDLRNRSSYLNVRNALRQISALGAIPIVNENDCVAVDELMTTFGDNDRLAASVAGLLSDAMLIILSDVDGLFDGDPAAPHTQVIHTVDTIDAEILSLARDSSSGVSKGGMSSKLAAATTATSHGQSVIIAPGHDETVLQKIAGGEPIGTLFLPDEKAIRGRLRWINSAAGVVGRLHLDPGAAVAVGQRGKSLLAIGIEKVDGVFERGEVVALVDRELNEIGRGLINYPSSEVAQILGSPSDQIADILGHCPYETVIHCDNMVALTQ